MRRSAVVLALALTILPGCGSKPSAAESVCLELHSTQDYTGNMRPLLGEEDSATVDQCIRTGELTDFGN